MHFDKISFCSIIAQSHRRLLDFLTFSLAKQLATLNAMSPFFQAMSFLVESDIILSTVLSKCFLNLLTKRWLVYGFILSCFPTSVMYTLLYLSSNWDTSVAVFFSMTRLLTNAMKSFNAEDCFQVWFFWVFCVSRFVCVLSFTYMMVFGFHYCKIRSISKLTTSSFCK